MCAVCARPQVTCGGASRQHSLATRAFSVFLCWKGTVGQFSRGLEGILMSNHVVGSNVTGRPSSCRRRRRRGSTRSWHCGRKICTHRVCIPGPLLSNYREILLSGL